MMRLNPGTAAKAMVLCILFALPPAALAQDSTLTGTITDSTDAALPGVAVTATHVASGNTFVGTSDSGGQYRVGPVRPGVYRIRAELQGFTTMTLENLEVLVGQRLVANVKLTISSVQESVTVTGEPARTQFKRGDSDGNGDLQLTDAVRILNVLFLGTGVLTCLDAADSDDNGQIQLTDAVRILNVLFLGTGTIPAPGPLSCGDDAAPDTLADCVYDPAKC